VEILEFAAKAWGFIFCAAMLVWFCSLVEEAVRDEIKRKRGRKDGKDPKGTI